MNKTLISIAIRVKLVGETDYENDNDLGMFCQERFYTLQGAIDFASTKASVVARFKQGSYCPHNPLYWRWSEFRLEFYESEHKYAWHRILFSKHGRCVHQRSYTTQFMEAAV